jgi:hypothetical protein
MSADPDLEQAWRLLELLDHWQALEAFRQHPGDQL